MTGRRPAQPKRAIMETNIPANEPHRARLIGIVKRSLHRPARHLQNQGKNAKRSIDIAVQLASDPFDPSCRQR